MDFKKNWHQKSIEDLEKDYWNEPTYFSSTVVRCYGLRKKPLNEFTVEDIRLMISQQIGLKYLIPMAIDILKDNLFVEGDFYEGDLLNAVLSINNAVWDKHQSQRLILDTLISQHLNELDVKRINFKNFYSSE